MILGLAKEEGNCNNGNGWPIIEHRTEALGTRPKISSLESLQIFLVRSFCIRVNGDRINTKLRNTEFALG